MSKCYAKDEIFKGDVGNHMSISIIVEIYIFYKKNEIINPLRPIGEHLCFI